jgi:dephospho-CoA kinase
MIKIGLTGSIGMGKSETAKIFLSLGLPVYDADEAVHRLYKKGNKGSAAVKLLFPNTITEEGDVDRVLLGETVVGNNESLKKLESIIHPLVANDRNYFFEKNINAKFVVLDIPLLFETGGDKFVDYIVVASTSKSIQKKRVLDRPNMTEEKFKKILSKQISNEEKCKRADFVIDTSISIDDARKQVKNVIVKLES